MLLKVLSLFWHLYLRCLPGTDLWTVSPCLHSDPCNSSETLLESWQTASNVSCWLFVAGAMLPLLHSQTWNPAVRMCIQCQHNIHLSLLNSQQCFGACVLYVRVLGYLGHVSYVDTDETCYTLPFWPTHAGVCHSFHICGSLHFSLFFFVIHVCVSFMFYFTEQSYKYL